MFKKVLIANRGEIALRIGRACHELGVKTVAVYSEADRESLHVRFADEDVCIGPAPAAESYLNIPRIIAAAEVTGAEAIHPGYGFLAENAEFSEICARSDITFIGPTPTQIRSMGDKATARATMMEGRRADGSGLRRDRPHGRGGHSHRRGDRLSDHDQGVGRWWRKGHAPGDRPGEFPEALHSRTATRGTAAFGNPDVYLERCIIKPRHVEIQVFGDRTAGSCISASATAPFSGDIRSWSRRLPHRLSRPKIEGRDGRRRVLAAKAIDYVGAGTVEFLLDEDGSFYFMEMNTRIQVEHPVTEVTTGIDLLKEQIRVAAGEPLAAPDTVEHRVHAIEFRVNAEDPDRNFAPGPGRSRRSIRREGPGSASIRTSTPATRCRRTTIRCSRSSSSAATHGTRRSFGHDMCWISSSSREFPTTIPFLRRIVDDEAFVRGDVDTGFVARMMAEEEGSTG